jgi:hypothetical protein
MSYQNQPNIRHALGHRMLNGVFDRGACAYCGVLTLDFCPECGVFVCRGCDTSRHWPAVGIFPHVGFGLRIPGHGPVKKI